MRTTTISVLMSTYHGDKLSYLKESIESIIQQTLQPLEIIIVVDGGILSENQDYLNSLAGKYKEGFIKLIWNDWKGIAGALNDGLPHCSGSLIARMDSDDIALPTRFEKQVDFMQSNKLDLVACWHQEFTELDPSFYKVKLCPQSHQEIVDKLVYRNVISHPSIIIKNNLFKEVGYKQDMASSEDYDLYYRLIAKGAQLGCLQEPLVKVRVTGQVERRSSLKFLKVDWKLKIGALKRGNLNFVNFTTSLFLLVTFRVLPVWLKKEVYKFLRN